MKILIYSPAFYPSVGGIERIMLILAQEFVRHGVDFIVVSQVATTVKDVFPFKIVRCPNPLRLFKLVRWCDIYFHASVSLKGIWPLLVVHRPWIVAHHGGYSRADGTLGWQDHLKRYVMRFATCISVSHAFARQLTVPSIVIHNAYEDHIFYRMPDIKKDKDIIFVGRLVSDKGVDLLLKALSNLKKMSLRPCLTIVGGGPEEANLKMQAKNLGIIDQVDITGAINDQALSRLMNAHKILALPSRRGEAFGIVILEGIACGCVAVGSDHGGIKEAIGPCGLTFPSESVEGLTDCLATLLSAASVLEYYRRSAEEHLSNHSPDKVANAYLDVFRKVIQSDKRS